MPTAIDEDGVEHESDYDEDSFKKSNNQPKEKIMHVSANGWSPDEDPRNADWLRTLSWDLPTEPDEFLQMLSRGKDLKESALRKAVINFLKLPAAEKMPKSLYRALYKRGLCE